MVFETTASAIPPPGPEKLPIVKGYFANRMVRKERFELSHPLGYYTLNVARLPFRHLRDLLSYITKKSCKAQLFWIGDL